LHGFLEPGPCLRFAAQVAVKGLLQAAEAAQAVPEHADYLRVCPQVSGCFQVGDGLACVPLGARVVPRRMQDQATYQ
jgi:hypothetical protein